MEELEQYLSTEIGVGFGLSIGGNMQIIDITFEGLADQESSIIKESLIKLFPDIVKFS